MVNITHEQVIGFLSCTGEAPRNIMKAIFKRRHVHYLVKSAHDSKWERHQIRTASLWPGSVNTIEDASFQHVLSRLRTLRPDPSTEALNNRFRAGLATEHHVLGVGATAPPRTVEVFQCLLRNAHRNHELL